MARKIKFALEMADGAKVRGSIEELREHFDLEKVVGYFLSGKLVEWLEDRFYEDEAEAIEAIDKDASDLRERLCEALGVEYEGDEALDVEALERLNEKKAILRQKTNDEDIIAHAAQTALNQEDLANLLEMDESVIYLCGEKFNIPARVKNKKYVGILGTPTINIKASSQSEADEKGIVFENVVLPWKQEELTAETKSTQFCGNCGAAIRVTAKFCESCGTPLNGTEAKPVQPAPAVPSNDAQKAEQKKMMDELFVSTFGKNTPIWLFVNRGFGDHQARSNIGTSTKQLCVKLLCHGQYVPEDIVHMCMDNDSSVGWALTYDSFCTGGRAGNHIIKYTDIKSITGQLDSIIVSTNHSTVTMNGNDLDSNILVNDRKLKTFLQNAITIAKMFEEKETPKSENPQTPVTESIASDNVWRFPKAQLKAMFASTFKENLEAYHVDPNATFLIVTKLSWNSSEATDNLTELQKETALALLCGGQYTEDDLIHLRVSNDMSYGWAFTRDSFCIVAENHGEIIPYESLSNTMNLSVGMFGMYEIPSKKHDYPVLCNKGLLPSNASSRLDYIEFRDMGWQETQVPLQKFLLNMKNMFRKR